MVLKKQGNFLKYCRIVPDVAAPGEPPPQRDRFGAQRNDDGDGHLAGTLIVRSIEGDGADRIAAKAQFALFAQPLPWLLPSFIDTPCGWPDRILAAAE